MIERLTETYNEKRTAASRSQSKAERFQKYGAMRFQEYAEVWKTGKRHRAVHLCPALASRRMNSFDDKVVGGFIRTMERAGAGLVNQANAFDKLRAILLVAHRLGIYSGNPAAGVKPPQYDPARAVIPSLEQLRAIRTAGDDAFMLIDGYLLRQQTGPRKPYPHWGMDNQWRRIRASGEVDIPEGMVLYGNRHFYASNCLSNGIPITDVAEWMGHKSADVTFKIYRHLVPGSIGKAAQVLDMALAA
ncbi:site-specific integrase [Streptomyces sp. NPDC005728]|uniref:site-specific integrase n=1 Tax=Streptomyces sp. NPDC005728 TaxID=3157054 RepID=UPI0033F98E29